jgi:hypothetical protein
MDGRSLDSEVRDIGDGDTPYLFLNPWLVQMFFHIVQPLCMYNAFCDLGSDIIYHPT